MAASLSENGREGTSCQQGINQINICWLKPLCKTIPASVTRDFHRGPTRAKSTAFYFSRIHQTPGSFSALQPQPYHYPCLSLILVSLEMLDELIRIKFFTLHLLINFSINGVATVTGGDLGTSFFSVTLFNTPGLNALGKLTPRDWIQASAEGLRVVFTFIDVCKMAKRRLFCDICKWQETQTSVSINNVPLPGHTHQFCYDCGSCCGKEAGLDSSHSDQMAWPAKYTTWSFTKCVQSLTLGGSPGIEQKWHIIVPS